MSVSLIEMGLRRSARVLARDAARGAAIAIATLSLLLPWHVRASRERARASRERARTPDSVFPSDVCSRNDAEPPLALTLHCRRHAGERTFAIITWQKAWMSR